MRIISGTHKGRIITLPKNFDARPTTDVAREGLFNILANRVDFEDLRVLDLFSGTGCISFEFASRGAREVLSVDSDPRKTQFIRSTAGALGFNAIQVFTYDAIRFLQKASGPFQIIFSDAPFDSNLSSQIHQWVKDRQLLAPGGVLIIEHPSGKVIIPTEGWLETRKYGGLSFSFYQFQ